MSGLGNSSSHVDANSVQAQFMALNRSRDILRQELHQIEGERRALEASMAQLKKRTAEISSEHRLLHESLGKQRMKTTLLEKEKKRLEELWKKEREELEREGERIQELVNASRNSKLEFGKKLQEISDSMEDLIQQHEDRYGCRMLRDSQSMEILCKAFESLNEVKGVSFEPNAEWVEASRRLQNCVELRNNMMEELRVLRDRARTLEPVRIALFLIL
jgi:chromosome segregation ATPase